MKLKLITGSLAAVAILAAGCSSSGGSHTAGGDTSSTSPAKAGAVTISLQNGHLVGPDGRSLYTNDKDTATSFGCDEDECLSEWPPVDGTPTAGAGLNQSAFATETRPDGSMQVTWKGKPLYEFKEDSGPGDTKGDGVNEDGILWALAKPAAAAGSGATSGSSSSSSSSGGGYGY